MTVLVIGDSCIDEYVYGVCSRLNPEAPVPVLDYNKTEVKKGMAANVCENLKAFGVEVELLTNKEKIVKTRFIDEKYNHPILRLDKHEEVTPLTVSSFFKNYDAIVISDYNKGFVSEDILFEIVEFSNCPVFIDTKKRRLPHGNQCFIKLNEVEMEGLINPPENIITTLGSKGAKFKDRVYPSRKVNVFDVVGAGDTFLAGLVYYYLLYNNVEKAIPYANEASSIAVQHRGTYILTKEDIKTIKLI